MAKILVKAENLRFRQKSQIKAKISDKAKILADGKISKSRSLAKISAAVDVKERGVGLARE